MSDPVITYLYELEDQERRAFRLVFDAESFALRTPPPEPIPQWARLPFEQCPPCSLECRGNALCPLAAHLAPLVTFAKNRTSFEKARVTVTTPDREYRIQTSLQRGISSLMGLLIPTSGCPHTEWLRPMARTHLPNANRDETMFRVVATYVVADRFLGSRSSPASLDFRELTTLYAQLHEINVSLTRRLRQACQKDCSLNALVILDAFTLFLPLEVRDSMRVVRSMVGEMMTKLSRLRQEGGGRSRESGSRNSECRG